MIGIFLIIICSLIIWGLIHQIIVLGDHKVYIQNKYNKYEIKKTDGGLYYARIKIGSFLFSDVYRLMMTEDFDGSKIDGKHLFVATSEEELVLELKRRYENYQLEKSKKMD